MQAMSIPISTSALAMATRIMTSSDFMGFPCFLALCCGFIGCPLPSKFCPILSYFPSFANSIFNFLQIDILKQSVNSAAAVLKFPKYTI